METSFARLGEGSRSDGRGASALVVIDMLNRYEHEDAEPLVRSVREALPAMQALIERARRERVLTVYVNDNYDDWSADRGKLLERALAGRYPSLVEPIAPATDVPFVTKARHSAFYETQLEYILRHEGIERVVLLGQVTEQCILYTALDAYVRNFSIRVAIDAVAPIDTDLGDAALRMMERNMRVEMVDVVASLTDTGSPRTSGV
jgi:nicotinamidase-related amidase